MKRIVGIVLALVITIGGLSAVNTQTAAADGIGHNAVVKASGSNLWVCKLLTGWKQSNFNCSDSFRYLKNGKTSKSSFGWKDTDAIWVTPGNSLQHRSVTPGRNGKYSWKTVARGGTNGYVYKVSGCFGCTETYRYV